MYKQNALISIIIPTFNRAHLLGETLDAIIAQTYKNWECIIVDDGSVDHTLDVLNTYVEKDARIYYYRRPSNLVKGVNSCREFGLYKSKGDYISWFDSDDLMHPDKLLKTMTCFVENDNLDCVVHNFNYFRPNVYEGKPYNDFIGVVNINKDYFSGDFIINFQSTLWKKSSLDINFMRSDLSYAEDVFFIGNHMIIKCFNVNVLNENLTRIRKHERSLTSSFINRPIDLIENEVFVRRYFYDIFFKEGTATYREDALKMYLKSLKYYLYANSYKQFLKKIVELFKREDLNTKLKLLKLCGIGLGYIFTKKGITFYQKVVDNS